MRTIQKILAALTAAGMLAGMLAGCGSSVDENKTPEQIPLRLVLGPVSHDHGTLGLDGTLHVMRLAAVYPDKCLLHGNRPL